MFETVDVVAARLLTDTPAQDDPYEPTLDPDGTLLDRAVELERLKSATDAELMLVYASMAERAETWLDLHDPDYRCEVGADDLVAAEIGPALRLTPRTAAHRVARAVDIVTRLPLTLAAYRRGDLDLGRVLAINEATQVLTDADAAEVEALVLHRAVDQTAGELRAALAKAVIVVDPDAAEKRRKRAVKDRYVTRSPDNDGTCSLTAVLSAVDAGEIYDLIDQHARQSKTENDTRTMDQRRADAYPMLLLGREPHLGPEAPPPPATDDPSDGDGPNGPDGPDTDDPGPDDPPPDEPDADEPEPDAEAPAPAEHAVQDLDDPGPDEPADPEDVPPDYSDGVTNPAWRDHELTRFDRIRDLAAHALASPRPHRPVRLPWVAINTTTNPDGQTVRVGELQGYGPITTEYAEHLLASGAARPPPAQTDREPTTDQVARHDAPEWLAEEVRARDGTCRFATCRQPAHRVDLDHAIEHPHGPTVRANLGGLCRRHHQLKTGRYWRAVQLDGGVYEWTSNLTGRSYKTYPRGQTGEWRGATNHA